MKRYFSLLPILALLLSACQAQDTHQIPNTLPDVHGYITSLKKTNSKKKAGVAEVLVESIEGVETNHARASLRIDGSTYIESLDGSIIPLDQLREGQMVEAWFDTPVMETFPVQAHASAIRVSN
ncbi:DUF3221 domain-containing protein [Pontibacter sp. JH31]|uniref:DUF3221 domain-containing protein n=1 Tax=Pontibacter aquaedesilientis TaxID=2766980 RepID=A0ABR7XF27_9BACT|nr:DUF3221 domain-containing protein [Pontibacter aquaedesilientis]MBD1396904.1 DUF3221 domain-containing protein [Pontibacter aquaedesilientis]